MALGGGEERRGLPINAQAGYVTRWAVDNETTRSDAIRRLLEKALGKVPTPASTATYHSGLMPRRF
jgi:hypothetical protein